MRGVSLTDRLGAVIINSTAAALPETSDTPNNPTHRANAISSVLNAAMRHGVRTDTVDISRGSVSTRSPLSDPVLLPEPGIPRDVNFLYWSDNPDRINPTDGSRLSVEDSKSIMLMLNPHRKHFLVFYMPKGTNWSGRQVRKSIRKAYSSIEEDHSSELVIILAGHVPAQACYRLLSSFASKSGHKVGISIEVDKDHFIFSGLDIYAPGSSDSIASFYNKARWLAVLAASNKTILCRLPITWVNMRAPNAPTVDPCSGLDRAFCSRLEQASSPDLAEIRASYCRQKKLVLINLRLQMKARFSDDEFTLPDEPDLSALESEVLDANKDDNDSCINVGRLGVLDIVRVAERQLRTYAVQKSPREKSKPATTISGAEIRTFYNKQQLALLSSFEVQTKDRCRENGLEICFSEDAQNTSTAETEPYAGSAKVDPLEIVKVAQEQHEGRPERCIRALLSELRDFLKRKQESVPFPRKREQITAAPSFLITGASAATSEGIGLSWTARRVIDYLCAQRDVQVAVADLVLREDQLRGASIFDECHYEERSSYERFHILIILSRDHPLDPGMMDWVEDLS